MGQRGEPCAEIVERHPQSILAQRLYFACDVAGLSHVDGLCDLENDM